MSLGTGAGRAWGQELASVQSHPPGPLEPTILGLALVCFLSRWSTSPQHIRFYSLEARSLRCGSRQAGPRFL